MQPWRIRQLRVGEEGSPTSVVMRYTAGMYKTFCRYGPRSVLVMLQQHTNLQHLGMGYMTAHLLLTAHSITNNLS